MAVILTIAALGAGALVCRRTPSRHSPDRRLAELVRALHARGIDPGGLTLHALAARLHQPAAAAYVNSLALMRFGAQAPSAAGTPTGPAVPTGRRALRRELARGASPLTRVRLLAALPPLSR